MGAENINIQDNLKESINNQELQFKELNDKVGKIDGYKDFLIFLNNIDKTLKENFLITFSDSKENPNILDYLNVDFGEGFPHDINGINNFIEKFNLEIISNIDVDKDNIDVDKDNIDVDKDNIDVDKDNIDIDKDNIDVDKDNIDKINDIGIEDIHKIEKKIFNNEIYKGFLKEKLNDENVQEGYIEWIKTKKVKEKSIELFIIEKNYKKLLDLAKKEDDKNGIDSKNPESEFAKLYSNLKFLENNNGLDIKLNSLEEEIKKYSELSTNSVGLTGGTIIENSFDTSFYGYTKINGDIISYGDQIIDAGKKPPVKYIGDSDFMLESGEVDYRPDRKKQKEIRKLSGKIEVNKEEVGKSIERKDDFIGKRKDIQGLDFTNIKALEGLYGVYIKSPEVKVMIEELDDMVTYKNEENSKGELKELLMKKLKGAILIDMDLNIREEVSKIEGLETEIKKDEDRLDTLMKEEEDRFGQYKEKLNENDERTRKYIKQYQSLGVGIVGQENLDYLFEQINSNPTLMQSIDLGNGKRINGKIDLSKGEFGQAIGQNPAEIMVRFLNKLYTGDPTEPISIDGFVSGSIEAVGKDMDKFKERVRKSKQNGGYGLGIDFKINSVENLKKAIEEEKKEKK